MASPCLLFLMITIANPRAMFSVKASALREGSKQQEQGICQTTSRFKVVQIEADLSVRRSSSTFSCYHSSVPDQEGGASRAVVSSAGQLHLKDVICCFPMDQSSSVFGRQLMVILVGVGLNITSANDTPAILTHD
ncbi:hypothetical protein L218DRAFT_669745 [Marasmius fiardii PR-910]|nr:hypothetical protein L218DRAFT_669745 [Marasmius fiardii PR-910]